jgi:hypothetical protein
MLIVAVACAVILGDLEQVELYADRAEAEARFEYLVSQDVGEVVLNCEVVK